jgi:hypothetical protein
MFRLLALLVLVTVSGCKETCEEKVYKAVQSEVLKLIKSPSTAVFPPLSEITYSESGPGCAPVYNGFVDAQNGFGAILRLNYQAATVPQQNGPHKVFILKMEQR